MKSFEPYKLLRPHLRSLKPYSSARNEFEGQARIHLDANENPYPETLNRYPDPLQKILKHKISSIKNVASNRIFLGNGSDEPIDLLIRAFCEPGVDKIITPVPTYGMYRVAAGINHVQIKEILLKESFDIDPDQILKAVDNQTKIIFLCSPNNPTGNCFSREAMLSIVRQFDGLVVVDEAYIDFSSQPGLLTEIDSYSNLVVLQTLSKAWGLAGLRLGMCFANPEIIEILNRIKPPYNISEVSQRAALEALSKHSAYQHTGTIIRDRNNLTKDLSKLSIVEKVFPSDTNFLLVRIKSAEACYRFLQDNGIIVRNRIHEPLCAGCLRITIGTPAENEKLLQTLAEFNPQIEA